MGDSIVQVHIMGDSIIQVHIMEDSRIQVHIMGDSIITSTISLSNKKEQLYIFDLRRVVICYIREKQSMPTQRAFAFLSISFQLCKVKTMS